MWSPRNDLSWVPFQPGPAAWDGSLTQRVPMLVPPRHSLCGHCPRSLSPVNLQVGTGRRWQCQGGRGSAGCQGSHKQPWRLRGETRVWLRLFPFQPRGSGGPGCPEVLPPCWHSFLTSLSGAVPVSCDGSRECRARSCVLKPSSWGQRKVTPSVYSGFCNHLCITT